MKILMVTLSALLFGCVESNKTILVKCSEEQLIMVEKQYKICSQTEYHNAFCYDQARVEQCGIIKSIEVNHEIQTN